MSLVEMIQVEYRRDRIEFLENHIEELEACSQSELNMLGRFACHASADAIRHEYPIIGDVTGGQFDLIVFGDPDYPDDPQKQGTFVSTQQLQEQEDSDE